MEESGQSANQTGDEERKTWKLRERQKRATDRKTDGDFKGKGNDERGMKPRWRKDEQRLKYNNKIEENKARIKETHAKKEGKWKKGERRGKGEKLAKGRKEDKLEMSKNENCEKW